MRGKGVLGGAFPLPPVGFFFPEPTELGDGSETDEERSELGGDGKESPLDKLNQPWPIRKKP